MQTRTNMAASTNAFIPAHIERDTRQYAHDGNLYKLMTLTPPSTGTRQPITLLAIIDTSGSMSEGVALPGETAADAAFTRLDLVKHALRTCIEVLEPQDSLAMISFNNDAKVILRTAKMTATNKAAAKSVLDVTSAGGGTNMWEGIRAAATLANDPELYEQNIVALLLTDGYPTASPPRGLIHALQTMISLKNPWTLHSFGFGYALDSKLLYDIAEWGHGLFGFIPDATMVGTVFINFLATVLSTAAVDPVHGIIQYGQPRAIVDSVAQQADPSGHEDPSSAPSTAADVAHVRHEYMNAIQSALAHCEARRMTDAQAVLTAFYIAHMDNPDAEVKAYLRDVQSSNSGEGQIGMAPAYFEKWGAHYMRAYLRAQQLQMCMNFKDPGLQVYGGDSFRAVQAIAERVFCDLPPPTPSAQRWGGYGVPAVAAAPTVSSMRIFHDVGGGCFHGDSMVLMADGRSKRITDIMEGERVKTPEGTAEVLAVVVCGQYAQTQPMTQIGTLLITPWHPVRDADGTWYFPAERHGSFDCCVSTVYNLVLNRDHIVIVEGVEAITLGHGLTGPVVGHEYFGTTAVIEDLNKQPGMEHGRPTYTNLVTVRDAETGRVVRWEDHV